MKSHLKVTRTLSRMKHQIVRLFTLADVSGLLERLVRLMAQSVEAVRPERSYPRKPGRGPQYATNKNPAESICGVFLFRMATTAYSTVDTLSR